MPYFLLTPAVVVCSFMNLRDTWTGFITHTVQSLIFYDFLCRISMKTSK